MSDNAINFVKFAIKVGAIQFGSLTLKPGRVSPYFFNTGVFSRGSSIGQLSNYYAETIAKSGVKCGGLFSPSYKDSPLAVGTVIRLHDTYGWDLPYSYDRKKKKDHSEGGKIVGAPISKDTIIIDVVNINRVTKRESVKLIKSEGGSVSAIILAFDRQERGKEKISAVAELERDLDIPILSIASANDLMTYLVSLDPETVVGTNQTGANILAHVAFENILKYQQKYAA